MQKRDKLGNVWVFVQLICRPTRTENQLYKKPNINQTYSFLHPLERKEGKRATKGEMKISRHFPSVPSLSRSPLLGFQNPHFRENGDVALSLEFAGEEEEDNTRTWMGLGAVYRVSHHLAELGWVDFGYSQGPFHCLPDSARGR